MTAENCEVIDSQLLAENVGFLDNCFDNSFALQTTLIAVKEYVAEERHELTLTKLSGVQTSKKSATAISKNKSSPADISDCKNGEILSQLLQDNIATNKHLNVWGLPHVIAHKYAERGITEMFDWQVTCLSNPRVLMDCCNLVYSAPTSAGKTLVAEILTIKTILERQKKVIIILPFVSIVREKMFYLQDILSSSGIRVEGFMGSQSPPGGLQAVHVAVCTIEKANSLVNRLLDDGNISDLGAVIVDELHLLGDHSRGYILELLLTKIKYVTSKFDEVKIQIVGMSATLPNLEVLARWLDAELFITQFRPIPLDEFCLVGNKMFDKDGICTNTLEDKIDHSDNVLKICLDTIKEKCSILIFCMTKNRCENLAQSISSSFYKLGCSGKEMGLILREQLNSESISEVLEQLKNCPVSLDQVLKNTISFGVAYHHAGLTFDERDIIEAAFKSGAIRVLVATSTLSSGVNLPARKVIIRTPVFQRQPINILTYKQMIGRAGRMGKDTKGESILICTEAEKKIGFDLMMGALDPVKSCIESEDKYMRAVIEMIASQVACTKDELELYSKCTLLFTQQHVKSSQNSLLEKTLQELRNYELVRTQGDGQDEKYVATPLGKACLSSSMAPNDGLSLFCELQKARQCLVLETDLHLIYLVTPYSVSSQWGDIDWLHLLTLWESLTKAMKRVGELVGIQESFIIRCLRGTNKMNNVQNKSNIHKRFYTALALQDLVNEVPLSEVATKFQCARGFLQSLQQAAATFAGMVTAFCHQLGWKNMEMLISQFQDRLHFGIHSELLDLMKLPSLNGTRARTLFDAGYETVSSIASAEVNSIENALYKAVPFQSEKERDGDDCDDMRKRRKLKNIWITGCCAMTAKEAAENLIQEARKYLQLEIGVKEIKWDCKAKTEESEKDTENDSCNVIVENVSVKDENPLSDSITTQSCVEDVQATVISTSNYVSVVSRQCKTVTNESLKREPLTNVAEVDKTLCGESLKKEPLTAATEVNDSIEKLKKCNSLDVNLSAKVCLNTEIFNKSEKDDIFNYTVNEIELLNNTSSPIINEVKKGITQMVSPIFRNATNTKLSPSILKDDIVWDSMNFTEAAIENVTRTRTANNYFSPNISFGESDDKSAISAPVGPISALTSSTKSTVKDISLFSSEGDNSSLFEESLPLDLIPSKLLDDKSTTQITKVFKQETPSDFVSINSNSILNGFESTIKKSTIVEVSDEEEIKLFYEEDIKPSDSESENNLNLSEDVVAVTQNINLIPIKSNHISPFKRQAQINDKYNSQPLAKKAKVEPKSDQKPSQIIAKAINGEMKFPNSKHFTLEIKKEKMKCFVLKENDTLENFPGIEESNEVAMYLDVSTKTKSSNEVIGSNIINAVHREIKSSETVPLVKGMALYFGQDTCFFLDFMNVKDVGTFKIKLSKWLQGKAVKLTLLSLKTDYVHIKNFFGTDLPETCFDISIAEWLIDSDEKIPTLVYLTKKFCELDLNKTSIKVNDREKKCLNSVEKCCMKAWSIWNIEKMEMQYLLQQYQSAHKIIDIEIHVAKILAECEYSGLHVDKELASQFLIDVKSTQEILQRKAFQMCGYHFNFNASKDVAKVLGMYRGRKVSTKKSVLTSHNSPMASVVIYWRKLNSILTKTLYPLTEKACIYSDGNRINPSYTMYTRTGRISMHEPNLQSVPRTFSIPSSYLTSSLSDDVIEFNCRRIFKAAPGHMLVSADYCQLEMRILTHYCGDEVLTRIMSSDVDVFKAIAASWGNVKEDQVDDDLRQKAKQLCYGILYGMGNKTLSQHLDVSEMEAAVFMDTFYKTYPAVKVFTAKVIGECRERGYVETLMKRRRYLPDVNSHIIAKKTKNTASNIDTKGRKRSGLGGTLNLFGEDRIIKIELHFSFRYSCNDVDRCLVMIDASERQAVNTTIQGSAADIAKAAMCSVDARTRHGCRPRLILQMHDELIYEVPEDSKIAFAKTLKQIMEGTVSLNVPLPVKVRSGDSWGTLEEIKL